VPDEGLDQLGPEDDQLERPSIGQLIAGVKQPSYMPRAAAPDASAAPPPGVRPQLDPNAIPDAIRPPSMPAPNEIARPPVGVNSQRRLDLMAQESKLNKPTDPGAIDPKTGKPMYKLGTGSKILGTIANALGAFGAAKTGQRYEPMDVGPGATNWKFGRAEELRKGQLAGVEQDLGEQEKLEGSQQKSYEDAIKAAYEGQLGEARLGTSKAQQETAGVRQQLEASQQARNEADTELKRTKAGQEPEPKTEPELALAYQAAVQKGDKQAAARYRGALDELKRQKAAGKDTSASDIAKTIQVAENRGKEHDRVDQRMETERTKRYAELEKDLDKAFVVGQARVTQSTAGKQKIDQELETKYAPQHQKVDEDSDKMLGLTKSGGPLKSTNAPKAQQAPAKPTTPAPAGRVWVYHKATGKRGTIPQAQVKQATTGPNAQYATW
jgi:hypothetical protein